MEAPLSALLASASCNKLIANSWQFSWQVRAGARCSKAFYRIVWPPNKGGTHMITEIAQIDVKPGTEAEFENGVKQAVPIFQRAKGCRSMELRRSIEKPSRYRLFIGWDTVENHTEDFRGSADFQEWRKLVGHCFASPPDVEHVTQVTRGFG
jgi:quinol monooxygenase YgiN